MVKYDYSKIDPVLRKNPDITYEEFKEKCSVKITRWSFLARRAFIAGKPGYGQKAVKKSTRKGNGGKTPKAIKKNGGKHKEDIDKVIDSIIPQSKLKDQYKIIALALLQDPLTTHSSMHKSKAITMSDANFYQFRRKFVKIMGLKPSGQGNGAARQISQPPRKKNVLYQTVYEKELGKNPNPRAMELLQDFVETLNNDRVMNLEIHEIIRPKHVIEIRKYSK